MKKIISVSLGPAKRDYEFETSFLGKRFSIRRVGVDGNLDKAQEVFTKLDKEADVFGLGNIRFSSEIGTKEAQRETGRLIRRLTFGLNTPVVRGEALRAVTHEWSLRHIQFTFGNNYFDNARVFFFSGMDRYMIAKVMAEFTDNLIFADPVIDYGIPRFLTSLQELEAFAKGPSGLLNFFPTRKITRTAIPLRSWNEHIIRQAVQKAQILVIPYYNFNTFIENLGVEELGGKIIVTSTVEDDKVKFLKDRGVDGIIDTTPKVLEKVVGVNVLEALIVAALDKAPEEVTRDDILEIISEQRMDPRVIYPSGTPKRVNRFAYVFHPLSREQLKKQKYLDIITRVIPDPLMDTVEKAAAYAPPYIYSRVTGIKSPAGVEAEGWIIALGATPEQLMQHDPEFTYKRLIRAAKMAKRMGAQIMGLGAFTKVVGDAGVTVAKMADIPITTGNSYNASSALWAAADAVRRMGLVKIEKGKKLKAKTMVVGATGAVGSICSRLLAKAFEEVYMVDSRDAKLLALRKSILEESPDVEVHVSTRADKYMNEMDLIVTTNLGREKKYFDIMKVKPGCVITDVGRPLLLTREDAEKRPDVLIIESGGILLPGNPEMKDIGLPPRVAYASLAETILLALEGRFEFFTVGQEVEWEKVREIYRMGLKHGMRLASITGMEGVLTDEDINRVKLEATRARNMQQTEENPE